MKSSLLRARVTHLALFVMLGAISLVVAAQDLNDLAVGTIRVEFAANQRELRWTRREICIWHRIRTRQSRGGTSACWIRKEI